MGGKWCPYFSSNQFHALVALFAEHPNLTPGQISVTLNDSRAMNRSLLVVSSLACFRLCSRVIIGIGLFLNQHTDGLSDTKQEHVVFQFRVLDMSIVALSNESIPHIIFSLVMHMMATAWAAIQIHYQWAVQRRFISTRLVLACQVPSLILNAIACIRISNI